MAGQSRAPAEAEDIQNNSCQGTRRALRQYLQKPLRGLGHAGMAARPAVACGPGKADQRAELIPSPAHERRICRSL